MVGLPRGQSGTEDVYTIYAQSFQSEDDLKKVPGDAQTLVGRLFKKT